MRLRNVSVVLAAITLLLSSSMAQTHPSDPTPATLVALGSVDGMRSRQVILDLRLDAPEGTEIRVLESEVAFPPRLLAFVSASKSAAIGNAALRADVKQDGGDPGKSVLKIVIAAGDAIRPVAAPLPNGILSSLVFRVAGDAEFGTVTLLMKSKAWTIDTPPKPVPMVVNLSGKVHISATGISSCFFYMH